MVDLIDDLVYLLLSALFIVLERALEDFLQHDLDLISAKTSASIFVNVTDHLVNGLGDTRAER